MGSDSSQVPRTDNSPKTIRTQSSYFGSSSEISNIDTENIENTIRDLRLERLYQRAPHLRPQANDSPQKQLQVQTVVSITDPEPYLRSVNGILLLSFGFKSESPCRFVLIGNNMINTANWPIANERVLVSLPLPAVCDFVLEVAPDLEGSPRKRGFIPVSKHTLYFVYSGEGDDGMPQFQYRHQILQAEEKSIKIDGGRRLPVLSEQHQGKCLVCGQDDATVAVGACGHNVLCQGCVDNRGIYFHHCPACDAKM